jgi:hypothetical protein
MNGVNSSALLLAMALSTIAADAADAPANGAAANASATNPAALPEASIPFANHGGIYNWQVVDDRTVLIQGLDRQWYKATLFSPCIDLPFAQRLGFESNPDGSFDKFSVITDRDQRCPLVSLVKTAAPGKKSKSNKAAAANAPVPTGSRPAAPTGASSPLPQ